MLIIQILKKCKPIFLKLPHIFIMAILFLIITSNISYSVDSNFRTSYTHDIVLDYNQTNGIIKPYTEINCGPLPNHDVNNGVDLTNEYQNIGIKFIRTHDFSGPTDISTIFPDMTADPNQESSYDFTISDQYITGIINAGSNVFYRLGESAAANKTLRNPPENMST